MKPVIYFVEDDEGINLLIETILTKNGFEPIGFLEPLSFLKEIEKRTPELILLDLMLPEMDGFSVLEKLKSDSRFAEIPVIILSAKSLEEDIVKGLDMGANDYIKKPFGQMELVSRINANLRKADMFKDKVLKIRDLSLDLAKHQLFYKDEIVEITSKEFDLMSLLMESPNIVVTRTKLFKKIWGSEVNIDAIYSRTLDMHIKFIREKIAKYTPDTYIETVRGVGYIINE